MRLAALICGLAGGLIALAIGVFGGMFFGAAAAVGVDNALVYQVLSYALPVMALIGAGLVWTSPTVGGLLLAATAVGIYIAFGLNSFSTLALLLTAAGGVLALSEGSQHASYVANGGGISRGAAAPAIASGQFVRTAMIAPEPAPAAAFGPTAWLRKRLFSTIPDSILTFIGILFLVWAVPPIYGFLIGDAVPPGGTVEQCRLETAGACWAYIADRITFFIYGFYPIDQFWRPNLVFIMGAALLIPLLWPKAPFKRVNALLFFIAFPIVSYILLAGGSFGLSAVPTERWGGLLVTLIISMVGIICSIPLGIVLALGRQSKLPIIKTLCVMFIELVRAVPLISILFMASIMLPLFVPQGVTIDKLLRALVAVTLFEAAYLAEVVRGGLQALPRGQYEAGASLGLGYWKRMIFIILPQALKHVIPGIVNNFISLFKDTTLVSIVGIFDLLNTIQAGTADINWSSPHQAITGYIFAGMVFWIFCFAMSRYSMFMERRLDTGHKR